MSSFIHETAEVSPEASIGDGCSVWNWTKIREHAVIGRDVSVGQCSYIDHGVTIGDGCRIQNGANIYAGVRLGDDVFVGPAVAFTNDLRPRASGDWELIETIVEQGASLGANATIRCGVTIGAGAMVGAGSVVLHDVAPGELVVGNPARVIGHVDAEGNRVEVAR